MDIINANSKDLFCKLLTLSLLSALITLDKLGSNTTPNAIPNIAKGN